jgi:hypothetical protein
VQRRRSLVSSTGGESNSISTEGYCSSVLPPAAHARAAEELGAEERKADGEQQAMVRTAYRRRPKPVVGDQVQQPGLRLGSQRRGEVALGDVAVDEEHGEVALQRQAQREVEAGEGLAVAGQCAGHHQGARAGAGQGVEFQRARDQRPLDLAVLVGNLLLVILRRQRAEVAQARARQRNFGVRLDRRGSRLWRFADVRRRRYRRDAGGRRLGDAAATLVQAGQCFFDQA